MRAGSPQEPPFSLENSNRGLEREQGGEGAGGRREGGCVCVWARVCVWGGGEGYQPNTGLAQSPGERWGDGVCGEQGNRGRGLGGVRRWWGRADGLSQSCCVVFVVAVVDGDRGGGQGGYVWG